MGAELLGLKVCSVPVVTAAFTEKPCQCSEMSDRTAEYAGPWLIGALVLVGAGPSCSGHSPWCYPEPGPSFSYYPLLAWYHPGCPPGHGDSVSMRAGVGGGVGGWSV